ncbi:MAG: sensor domain-containing diguanylate cyclase, partial [Proteobacteria bacterium]|nr:sensor domain-containing diguanylate cyclase [Pseudomonadota bacterium]
MLPTEAVSSSHDPLEAQVERIRRIGKQLFRVADCVVIFGDRAGNVFHSPIASAETDFCAGLPKPAGVTVVPDARLDAALGRHPAVQGAPNVRFHAAHPIHDGENAIIGSISLVDYAPRIFSETDGRLLADLAALVEREIHLKSVNASQVNLQRQNKSLRRKSLIDPLLGTWNRGAIMRILMVEADRCEKQNLPLSLIVVDLDHFKKINDTHGHPAGDEVLVKVASRLRSCIRPQEALGRYGGEEFLVVLPGACHETALAVAERMRQAVAMQPETVGAVALNLTISAGVASTAQFPSATTEELISRADVALYAAKDAGRNRVMQADAGHV